MAGDFGLCRVLSQRRDEKFTPVHVFDRAGRQPTVFRRRSRRAISCAYPKGCCVILARRSALAGETRPSRALRRRLPRSTSDLLHISQNRLPRSVATARGVGVVFKCEGDIDARSSLQLGYPVGKIPCLGAQWSGLPFRAWLRRFEADENVLFVLHVRGGGHFYAAHYEHRRRVSESKGSQAQHVGDGFIRDLGKIDFSIDRERGLEICRSEQCTGMGAKSHAKFVDTFGGERDACRLPVPTEFGE